MKNIDALHKKALKDNNSCKNLMNPLVPKEMNERLVDNKSKGYILHQRSTVFLKVARKKL